MKDISFFFTHPVQCVSIEFNDPQKKALYTWELYTVIINFQCVQDFVFADY